MKSKKSIFAILAVAVILVATLFIFINSFMDFEVSHGLSQFIMKLFFQNGSGNVGGDDFLLRKAAHLAEYFMLGVAVSVLALFYHKNQGKKRFLFSLIYVVAIALLDEFIQSCSDRNGNFGDVILDVIGALLGFCAVFCVDLIIKCLKNKKAGR